MMRIIVLLVAAVVCATASAVAIDQDHHHNAVQAAQLTDTLDHVWETVANETSAAIDAVESSIHQALYGASSASSGGGGEEVVRMRGAAKALHHLHKSIFNDAWNALRNKTNELLEDMEVMLLGSEEDDDEVEEEEEEGKKPVAVVKERLRHVKQSASVTSKLASSPSSGGTKSPSQRISMNSVALIGAVVGALIGAILAVVLVVCRSMQATQSISVLATHAADVSAASDANDVEIHGSVDSDRDQDALECGDIDDNDEILTGSV